MYQELNSNMIGLLTDLQGSIREPRAELGQVRAELQSRPAASRPEPQPRSLITDAGLIFTCRG